MAIPSLSDNALLSMGAPEDPASPEEIFLAWLLDLPDGLDASHAAALEVLRLDETLLRSRRSKRLRELFVAAAECAVQKRHWANSQRKQE
jgi:hypothetical protein